MRFKKYISSMIMLLLVVSLLPVSVFAATGITTANEVTESTSAQVTSAKGGFDIEWVKLNGDEVDPSDDLNVERGEDLDLRVKIEANDVDLENVEVHAFIAGYKYGVYESDLVRDFSDTKDIDAGESKIFDLSLQVPYDMDLKDTKIRVYVYDENTPGSESFEYQLSIHGSDRADMIMIEIFEVEPSYTVQAGKYASFRVKIKNYGEKDVDDVNLIVRIPELGISLVEFIDDLDAGDTQSFEELVAVVPRDAKAGQYTVEAVVEYDRYESVTETKTLTVVAGESTSSSSSNNRDDSVVTVPDVVELSDSNTGVVYPVVIRNDGDNDRTYVLSVSDVSEFATAAFEPSSVVVVEAGRTQTVFLRLTANENAVAGDKVFKLSVRSGNDVTEANVVAKVKGDSSASSSNAVKVLEVIVIVLLIILIIAVLVFVFSRLAKRKDDDEEDEEDQTYY